MSIKDVVKSVAYRLAPPALPPGKKLSLAYIFHTEAVFDERLFARMVQFLRDYHALTGRKALSTVMSGAHPRVRSGMREAGCDEGTLVERFRVISAESELGYHGHYAFQPDRFAEFPQQIRGCSYDMAAIREQVERELRWFAETGLRVGPFYSGGWWFQAPELFALLAEKGFLLDGSVSYSPWFRQPNTYPWFREAGVRCAEPVVVGDRILAVQNLTGCHDTPFPEDFIRIARGLLKDAPAQGYAFVNSHDFDLKPDFALATLKRLASQGVTFTSATELLALREGARRIAFPAGSVGV